MNATPPSGAPLFRFEDVALTTGGTTILDGVDAAVPDGGVTALVGPSGSGKSTLLRLCNRLEAPTRGRVLFRGADVAALDVLAHRRRVGMVFQRPTLFPGSVRDNLLVAAPAAGEEAMAAALDSAHLSAAFLGRVADELSGGEAQRACLARALLVGPEVLLRDEPTSALDAEAAAVLERLARGLAAGGVPVVWVSHDPAQVARVADNVIEMAAGRVVAARPAADGGAR